MTCALYGKEAGHCTGGMSRNYGCALVLMVAAIATPSSAFSQGPGVSVAQAGKLAASSGALALRHHRGDGIVATGRGRRLLLASATFVSSSSSSSSSDPCMPDRPAMRLRGGAIMPRLGLLRRRRATAVKSSIMPANNGDNMSKKPTAIYLLVVVNVAMFLLQTFSTLPLHTLYLDHHRPALYQFVTSTICHANAQHLSSNLFPLLVFGRLVEEEMGFTGLLLTFLICGAASNLASIFFMPSATLSLGASGAVFGLFTVAVAARVSMREAAWRSWVEVCVFGQYVWERLRSEVAVTAGGGIAGVNHVAHLGGAAAGLLMVMCLRILLGALEKGEEGGQGGKRAKVIK